MHDAGAPQLVGANCTLCDKTIGSIAHGKFCSLCSCPVHHKCVAKQSLRRRDTCRECGSSTQIVETIKEKERIELATIERDVRSSQGIRHIMFGMMLIVGGVLAAVFCFGASGGRYIIGGAPVLIGVFQVLFGFIRLVGQRPPDASGPSSEPPST